jgi:hypothetical protein
MGQCEPGLASLETRLMVPLLQSIVLCQGSGFKLDMNSMLTHEVDSFRSFASYYLGSPQGVLVAVTLHFVILFGRFQ